jgi:hypothetical protein
LQLGSPAHAAHRGNNVSKRVSAALHRRSFPVGLNLFVFFNINSARMALLTLNPKGMQAAAMINVFNPN